MSKIYTEKEQALDLSKPYDWGPEIDAGWREMVEKLEKEIMEHANIGEAKLGDR